MILLLYITLLLVTLTACNSRSKTLKSGDTGMYLMETSSTFAYKVGTRFFHTNEFEEN